jgi:hypothetical protein
MLWNNLHRNLHRNFLNFSLYKDTECFSRKTMRLLESAFLLCCLSKVQGYYQTHDEYGHDVVDDYHQSTPLQECLSSKLYCLEEPCDLECKCTLAGQALQCFKDCDSVLQTDQLYVAARLNYNSFCSAFILDENPVDPPPVEDPVVDPVPTDPTDTPVVDPVPTSTDVVEPTSTDVVEPTSTDVVEPTNTDDPLVEPTPTEEPVPDGFQASNPDSDASEDFNQEESHGSIYSAGTRMEVMWLLIIFGVIVM